MLKKLRLVSTEPAAAQIEIIKDWLGRREIPTTLVALRDKSALASVAWMKRSGIRGTRVTGVRVLVRCMRINSSKMHARGRRRRLRMPWLDRKPGGTPRSSKFTMGTLTDAPRPGGRGHGPRQLYSATALPESASLVHHLIPISAHMNVGKARARRAFK